MIATEGQLGYGLIQWQTIAELMGERRGMCASVSVSAYMHLHA